MSSGKFHMNLPRSIWPYRPALILALTLSIPAFYLMLTGPSAHYRGAGSLLYAATAMLMAIDIGTHKQKSGRHIFLWNEYALDVMIFLGALASAWPTAPSWSLIQWLFRLGFCGLVFTRIAILIFKWVAPRHLLQVLGIGIGGFLLAGLGFYWLEPKVLTYADGLWLAFITGATVGYGDLVPSTAASRIFAVFIVLLGYAIFSVVTASIAALFVGKDEKRFEKELHSDIKFLRKEISTLRDEMRRSGVIGKK
ncbi:MAG TPA: potassium channel family protein [Burkholderiaceae bacterium]|nr:potassium channel family protein [Burkholderiaceae bacterium]